jgi:hypothetical protein
MNMCLNFLKESQKQDFEQTFECFKKLK